MYYNAGDIENYIIEKNSELENKRNQPLTPADEAINKLKQGSDLIGFFWIEIIDGNDGGVFVKRKGKSFIKIGKDLYTDDRFALDLYQAKLEKKSVEQVVKDRDEEIERANNTIENFD